MTRPQPRGSEAPRAGRFPCCCTRGPGEARVLSPQARAQERRTNHTYITRTRLLYVMTFGRARLGALTHVLTSQKTPLEPTPPAHGRCAPWSQFPWRLGGVLQGTPCPCRAGRPQSPSVGVHDPEAPGHLVLVGSASPTGEGQAATEGGDLRAPGPTEPGPRGHCPGCVCGKRSSERWPPGGTDSLRKLVQGSLGGAAVWRLPLA